MPFVEKYAVDFSNGNLKPSLNTLNWPDMVHASASPSDQADNRGLMLNVTRSNPAAGAAANSLYVPLAAGVLSIDTRLLMRVEFDMPYAEPLPNSSVMPSPWAVVLGVSRTANLDDPTKMAIVTCQFHQANGVRVNTPGGLQGDQSTALDPPPPNYALYANPQPNHSQFTLEHSFCGVNAVATKHAVGAGWLTIQRNPAQSETDHRLYSTSAVSFTNPGDPVPPPILSLGIAVTTQTGLGSLRARIRRFSVSFH